MSKRCPKCDSTNTSKDWYAHDQGVCYVCADCCYVGDPEEFREQTVFEHITANEEALAEKLVFLKAVLYSCNTKDNTNYIEQWISTICNDVYSSKHEAFAATVAELKKAWKS